MANARGPKRAAWQKAFNARPEEKKRRAAQGRARYAYEKKNGPLPEGVDLDHKRPVREGGGYSESNLRPKKDTENRGWSKGKKRGKT